MNVLSLFDGMSCGQIALQRAGIPVENYYASEIDKYAIQVTQHNFPKTIQLGSVVDVSGSGLPAIDLLMGGSPCQGFSSAGLKLKFDDPRSALFFEFVRLLRECKPRWFLLENVEMAKRDEYIITSYMGVEPYRFNSALVSAQLRSRLYWTNIPIKEAPEDRGITLKDIIESGYPNRAKSFCIDANYGKGGYKKSYTQASRRQMVSLRQDHIPANALFPDQYGERNEPNYEDMRNARILTVKECCRLQTVPDNYFDGLNIPKFQRYHMLGNGWTVDMIVHILNYIK